MHILSRHLLVLPIQLLFIPSIRTTSILFVFCSLGDVGCTTGFWKAPHMISDSGTITWNIFQRRYAESGTFLISTLLRVLNWWNLSLLWVTFVWI